jgi:hypothetical protein
MLKISGGEFGYVLLSSHIAHTEYGKYFWHHKWIESVRPHAEGYWRSWRALLMEFRGVHPELAHLDVEISFNEQDTQFLGVGEAVDKGYFVPERAQL